MLRIKVPARRDHFHRIARPNFGGLGRAACRRRNGWRTGEREGHANPRAAHVRVEEELVLAKVVHIQIAPAYKQGNGGLNFVTERATGLVVEIRAAPPASPKAVIDALGDSASVILAPPRPSTQLCDREMPPR